MSVVIAVTTGVTGGIKLDKTVSVMVATETSKVRRPDEIM
jgi:hypothetical protein